MILVDTSVWIEFFRRNDNYVAKLESLLRERAVITIEPIFSELLFGVRTKKDHRIITSYWHILPKINFSSNTMLEAATYANRNQYMQLGIGLVDAIIIKSAVEGEHVLWTLDKRINQNLHKKNIYVD